MSGSSDESLDALSRAGVRNSAGDINLAMMASTLNLTSEELLGIEPSPSENSSAAEFPGDQKPEGDEDDEALLSKGASLVDTILKKPHPASLATDTASFYTYPVKHKATVKVRRKKMYIWILIFLLVLTCTGFSDILHRLYYENDDVFSMSIIKPWLTPFLIAEFALTGVVLLTVLIKMKLLQDPCVNSFFRFMLVFNNLQYLAVLLLLPRGISYFLSVLSNEMQAELADDNSLGHGAGKIWNATQLERKCCGYASRKDWKMVIEHDLEEGKKYKFEDEDEHHYPLSCCNLTAPHPHGWTCTESTKMYWTVGCFDAEFYFILEYALLQLGLVFVSFVLSFMIRLRVDKLERYLTIFSPQDLF